MTDKAARPSRTATCGCGQLQSRAYGEPQGISVCNCLASTAKNRECLAALSAFAPLLDVAGTVTEYVRAGNQGVGFTLRSCPVRGTNLFHTEVGVDGSVTDAVGAYADTDIPPHQVSAHEYRRHTWVQLPPDVTKFDKDPL